MVKRFTNMFKKTRYVVLGGALLLSLAAAGTVEFIHSNASQTSAATCDKVNIVYCGLKGTTPAGYISSFKSYYNSGSDGRYNDLKAVYRWAGATDASVNNMTVNNTKVGTLYKNGDIKVDGKLVGHDPSMVSARFGAGRDGFVHIEGNVWARSTKTSFAEASAPVIVHFDGNGQADFAVMIGCGNAVKVTPIPPKPVLVCQDLNFSNPDKDRTYTFTAKAYAKNTEITSYVFDFGDGHKFTRLTHASTASVVHGYAHPDTTYHVSVTVNSTKLKGVTSPACHVSFKTPKAPATLACVSLTKSPLDGQKDGFTFTAQAKATNTKITSYVFNFGDGTKQTKNTSAEKISTTHSYKDTTKKYVASVVVNSEDIKNVTSEHCKVTIPAIPPKPTLICVNLDATEVDKSLTYKFVATAKAEHTAITNYVFDFGDGSKPQTIKTSDTTAKASHTYKEHNKQYTAKVSVNGDGFKDVTSKDCQKTFTTPKAPVKPQLTCDSLTFESTSSDSLTYSFTAQATADHTTITSYVFNFNDGKPVTVKTSDNTAHATHTFTERGHTYHASVSVNSTDFKDVTSAHCKVDVTTPKTPKTPVLTCEQLTFSAIIGNNTKANSYTFTATANAVNTKITSYVFYFGDDTNHKVTTDAMKATTTHTYPNASKDYSAYVVVNSTRKDGVTSDTCEVTIPKQTECKPGVPTGSDKCNECKPGVPSGSEKCEECKPGVPAGSDECTPPTQLPNTGAGNVIGLFGATTVAGGLLHRFLLRRKYMA